ncbi:hypothetical protein KKA17_11700 [bacterium]|nr:hypothetical protein [bacterium]MBU1883675.1 hypothetical protein [bacterium]
MGTPIDYIYENELQWQPSLRGALETAGRFGYRGELIITAGEFLSPEKQLPPKLMLKHAIVITDAESTLLFAAELDDFANFEKAFELYKDIFMPKTILTLFINNLLSDAIFEYNGITVNAFALDESSVWNELISHADLDKKELKRMGAEEKLDALYDGLKTATFYAKKMPYEEACALKMG